MRKYQGCAPSLVVHLHPTHFRFDQQEGTFTYKSPMKVFIEHLRTGTVPHDLIDQLTDAGVTFFEGCLIVEIHDHKSLAVIKDVPQGSKPLEKTEPFSIHHQSDYLTPSPWIPALKYLMALQGKSATAKESEEPKEKASPEKDKENMRAPNQPTDSQRAKSQKAKISTVVLHPTALSKHMDIVNKSTTPVVQPILPDRRDSRPDPLLASSSNLMLNIPSTPMEPPPKRQKREKMELDGKTVHAAESQIILATTPALYLDVVDDAIGSALLLEALSHPEHSAAVPAPKTRKKTVAEMAAEESAAADEEKYMLLLDERLSSSGGAPGGANTADGEGQTGGASWEPRFERFKALENIKIAVVEKKKQEQINRQKAADRLAAENSAREQRRQEEAAKLKVEEDLRQAQLSKQQQAQQAMYRNQMAQQAANAGRNMMGQNGQTGPGQGQGSAVHAHPQQNGAMANGMTPQQVQRLMAQQQANQTMQGASSPIVRNATPHNLSSPMVASNIGAPMQQTNSGMGGSPARPGSVVQQSHQLNPAMAQAMRAQNSQQSHAGTPHIQNATPNMSQTVPRQLNQTPRMSHSSPMPGNMAATPHMQSAMMANGQGMGMPMPNMQQQAMLAQQQQQLRLAAQQQALGQSPSGHNQLSQQQQQFQNAMRQQQLHNLAQNNPGLMNSAQISNSYTAAMQQMMRANGGQNMQANPQQFMNQGGMQGMQNMHAMNGMQGMTPQMMQQLQQQTQHQQAQQQAQQQQHQQQGQGQTIQQQMQAQQQAMMQKFTAQAQAAKFQQLMLSAGQQYGGPNQIPGELMQQMRRQAAQQGAIEARARMTQWQSQQQQNQMRAAMNMQGMGMQGMQRQ